MKDINYPYFVGALECFIQSLPYDMDYNNMNVIEKKEYLDSNIKRIEQKAIDFNKIVS